MIHSPLGWNWHPSKNPDVCLVRKPRGPPKSLIFLIKKMGKTSDPRAVDSHPHDSNSPNSKAGLPWPLSPAFPKIPSFDHGSAFRRWDVPSRFPSFSQVHDGTVETDSFVATWMRLKKKKLGQTAVLCLWFHFPR